MRNDFRVKPGRDQVIARLISAARMKYVANDEVSSECGTTKVLLAVKSRNVITCRFYDYSRYNSLDKLENTISSILKGWGYSVIFSRTDEKKPQFVQFTH